MRIDVFSIFPDYLAPLELSLIGKARREGLLEVHSHDLRRFTHDRHHTVDDTPYGGGAGMVMTPQPWGEALDELVGSAGGQLPTLIVPGPGGEPFTQTTAYELAGVPWLAFACGRYEGIDERVYDEARSQLGPERVRILSLGDYVLNGGEVAVLAMIEAIARLLPGVIGNEESLTEESHTGGLLEYPVYTKPATWRGHQVPQVLLSGDHQRIAAWRHDQRLARTATRRPDLLPSSATLAGGGKQPLQIVPATPADAAELFVLTRACWLDEGRTAGTFDIPPLTEDMDAMKATVAPGSPWHTWVVRDPQSGRLVGSVRGRSWRGAPDLSEPLEENVGSDRGRFWEIGRLMVAPDLHGRGLGQELLAHVVRSAPTQATTAWLVTGANSSRNLRFYRKAGFRRSRVASPYPGTVALERALSEDDL
ncbi:tRNA (guanosine(37)-N1)-methyltransferase TrmD [Austwickia sp. TVS 96-490-7B]|uniref:tRNA (guanosine(37)-N1)-methyltransferase TrmD n=1 Tax=Austwickia sp. TVS 96-490-7B TaxID=2830843 RepID=UPI001C5866D1|nr:tRNA (guanosine(37)-N1)-methyltransferase TrmD [Austwickia sp. TVS 96-490-7B]